MSVVHHPHHTVTVFTAGTAVTATTLAGAKKLKWSVLNVQILPVTVHVSSGAFLVRLLPSSDLKTLIVWPLYPTTWIVTVKYPVVGRSGTFDPTFTVVMISWVYVVLLVDEGKNQYNSLWVA